MKSTQAITALSALAQGSRLALYRLLVRRGPDGYIPRELAEKLKIPAPTLSFHLKELQRANLITVRRHGRFLHYSVKFDTMQALIGFLTEKCCSLSNSDRDSTC